MIDKDRALQRFIRLVNEERSTPVGSTEHNVARQKLHSCADYIQSLLKLESEQTNSEEAECRLVRNEQGKVEVWSEGKHIGSQG